MSKQPVNSHPISQRDKYVMAGKPITLDGHPATLSGLAMPEATVTDNVTGNHIIMSWELVRTGIARGGKFWDKKEPQK